MAGMSTPSLFNFPSPWWGHPGVIFDDPFFVWGHPVVIFLTGYAAPCWIEPLILLAFYRRERPCWAMLDVAGKMSDFTRISVTPCLGLVFQHGVFFGVIQGPFVRSFGDEMPINLPDHLHRTVSH